jgi:hypothetical protein
VVLIYGTSPFFITGSNGLFNLVDDIVTREEVPVNHNGRNRFYAKVFHYHFYHFYFNFPRNGDQPEVVAIFFVQSVELCGIGCAFMALIRIEIEDIVSFVETNFIVLQQSETQFNVKL